MKNETIGRHLGGRSVEEVDELLRIAKDLMMGNSDFRKLITADVEAATDAPPIAPVVFPVPKTPALATPPPPVFTIHHPPAKPITWRRPLLGPVRRRS